MQNNRIPSANTAAVSLKLSADSEFSYKEAYNALRTNVMFSLAALDSGKKTIAVSSASPSEGKSTVSSNLAISLAKLQLKIILIDADMRRPSLHRVFGVKTDCGLSDILLSKSAENSIVGIPGLNLDFLPAGTLPPNPSELLGSSRFEQLITELEHIYDYIIVDTPPVLAVSDTLMLSKVAAGVLLTCRHKKTAYSDFSKAIEKLNFAKVPIVGSVIVGKKESSHKFNKSYY